MQMSLRSVIKYKIANEHGTSILISNTASLLEIRYRTMQKHYPLRTTDPKQQGGLHSWQSALLRSTLLNVYIPWKLHCLGPPISDLDSHSYGVLHTWGSTFLWVYIVGVCALGGLHS